MSKCEIGDLIWGSVTDDSNQKIFLLGPHTVKKFTLHSVISRSQEQPHDPEVSKH